MLPDPIARHAYPRNVSDAAFAQLVDGNPNDKDAKGQPIKPKDGDITGPIQVNEDAWIIMKREEVVQPLKAGSLTDPAVRNMLQAQMFDVKLNDAMKNVYEDLVKASTIDNKLTGQIRTAHEEQDPDFTRGARRQGRADEQRRRDPRRRSRPATERPPGRDLARRGRPPARRDSLGGRPDRRFAPADHQGRPQAGPRN